MRRIVLSTLGLCVLLAAGCQQSSFDKSITIEKDVPYHEVEFRGPKSDQTMEVIVTSDDAPVIVHVTLADEKHEIIAALRAGKKPRKTLASSEPAKEAKLEAKVGAGHGFLVLIQPAEKGTEVKVKLDVHEK